MNLVIMFFKTKPSNYKQLSYFLDLKTLGDSDTFKSPINKIRKSGPLKDCEGPQKYDIKDPNDPWQFLFISTPASPFPIFHLSSILRY